jgi:putative membrane protein
VRLPPFEWHLDAVLLMAAIEAWYLWALARLGPRSVPPGAEVASRRQRTWWTAGVATLLVASVWPIHDLSEGYLFSVHMVQHTLISLVAPPMFLLGCPSWLLRRMIAPRPIHALVSQATRPVIAFVLFNTVIVVTHWPPIVDGMLQHHPWHFVAHAVLFGSATCMWWPVVSPLPEMPTLSYPGRMLYLFVQSIVPTVPASFLTFGSSPLYAFYEHAPRIWGWSALTDQTIAGLIMKIVGGLILWGVIAALFFRWYAVEQRGGWDELAGAHLERDIRRGMNRRDDRVRIER